MLTAMKLKSGRILISSRSTSSGLGVCMSWNRDTGMREDRATFRGPTQNARVMTEDWASRSLYCPCCSADRLKKFPSNQPVADFFCEDCGEEFELKSQKRQFGRRVTDGAYESMRRRLAEPNSPSLFLLRYSQQDVRVQDVLLIPKFHFSEAAIEPRKPLRPEARRAGWVGCNILLDRIAGAGKIPILVEGRFEEPETVRKKWTSTAFLAAEGQASRGWLLETIQCAEQTSSSIFTLDEIYANEVRLQAVFPGNRNIRPKLRQQLQVMRDNGLIEFLGQGRYRKLSI
jgi:type II restriction enzyme